MIPNLRCGNLICLNLSQGQLFLTPVTKDCSVTGIPQSLKHVLGVRCKGLLYPTFCLSGSWAAVLLVSVLISRSSMADTVLYQMAMAEMPLGGVDMLSL